VLGSIYSHVIISLHCFHAVGPGRVCCGHWSVLESNSEQLCLYCGLGLIVAIGSNVSPVWCVISDNTDTWRNSRTLCSWMLCSSEVEEWLILVQRGYYNNPVPAYFSTSHLLILIQTRISISWLWTIISPVVDYYKPVVEYCKLAGLL